MRPQPTKRPSLLAPVSLASHHQSARYAASRCAAGESNDCVGRLSSCVLTPASRSVRLLMPQIYRTLISLYTPSIDKPVKSSLSRWNAAHLPEQHLHELTQAAVGSLRRESCSHLRVQCDLQQDDGGSMMIVHGPHISLVRDVQGRRLPRGISSPSRAFRSTTIRMSVATRIFTSRQLTRPVLLGR